MLASETIRQSVSTEMNANGDATGAEEAHEDQYAELVVLDRAGRAHVPQEYLEHFDIRGRAQLEITEDGILIRPAVQTQTAQVKVNGDSADASKRLPPRPQQPVPETKGVRKLLGRFSRKK